MPPKRKGQALKALMAQRNQARAVARAAEREQRAWTDVLGETDYQSSDWREVFRAAQDAAIHAESLRAEARTLEDAVRVAREKLR